MQIMHIPEKHALKLGEVQAAVKNSQFQWAKDFGDVLQYSSNFKHPDFNIGIQRMDFSTWSPAQIQVAQNELLKQYKALHLYARFKLVRELGSSYKLWNRKLILEALHDSYAPVRIAMLQILLNQPRPELNHEIEIIYMNDPVPWCGRLANEILLLKTDPLLPEKGILFTF